MIEIKLFGPTRVSLGDTTLVARGLGGSKPRQVLEILAVELGRPVTKDSLAERLWEVRPPPTYIATLESYVCVLRKRLHDLGEGAQVLRTTTGGYLLDPSETHVDVVDVRRDLDSSDAAVLEATLPLRVDALLADDPYSEWAHHERDELSAQRVQAYVAAAHQQNEVGDHARAIMFAKAAGLEGSWCEPATQELMEALARSGNHAQALLEYQSLRTAMRDDIGVEPSPATQELYMTILRHDAPEPGYDVATLLTLLRHALEAATGNAAGGPDMAEVGQMLLQRC